MAVYEIPKPVLESFGKPGKPFLSFDQFNNVVQRYRDEYYAAQNIDGFIQDIGVAYNLWTVDLQATYHRNLFFDLVPKSVRISIEIPEVQKHSSFPLSIVIFDDAGAYFTQTQNIAVERNIGGKFVLSAWRRVEPIRDFVLRETREIEKAA